MKLKYCAAGLCAALGIYSAAHAASVNPSYEIDVVGLITELDQNGKYIIDFDFMNLGASGVPNTVIGGSTYKPLGPDTVLQYGDLGFVLDGIVEGDLKGLSYTNGKGFGVWGPTGLTARDLLAIDGDKQEEALEIRIDANFDSQWKIYALWFTDSKSNNNAFASGGWTVKQVSASQNSGFDWNNDRNRLNGNDPFTFYSSGKPAGGNNALNDLRGDGKHVTNKSLSGDNNGLNVHIGGKDVSLYLSGISLLMEPEDARNLDLLAPVPLPAPVGMLLAGLGGLAVLRRRQAGQK